MESCKLRYFNSFEFFDHTRSRSDTSRSCVNFLFPLMARTEACWLYRLLGQDRNTIEELRGLIRVPPETERDARWRQTLDTADFVRECRNIGNRTKAKPLNSRIGRNAVAAWSDAIISKQS